MRLPRELEKIKTGSGLIHVRKLLTGETWNVIDSGGSIMKMIRDIDRKTETWVLIGHGCWLDMDVDFTLETGMARSSRLI